MSKYNNRRFLADGLHWDSQAEYNRWCELRFMAAHGLISDLTVKPKFTLLPAFKRDGKHYRGITYIADFRYVENGVEVIEDCKGFKTQEYKIKAKLMKAVYGIEIHEVPAVTGCPPTCGHVSHA